LTYTQSSRAFGSLSTTRQESGVLDGRIEGVSHGRMAIRPYINPVVGARLTSPLARRGFGQSAACLSTMMVTPN
jgi:hypothetical protein